MSKLKPVLLAVVAVATAVGCSGNIGDRFDSSGTPGGGIGPGPGGGTGPGGTGGPGGSGECNPVPTQIWKLSDSQYQRAVTDLLPSTKVTAIQTPGRSRFAPADYADELPVSGSMAAVFRQTAKDVAAPTVTNINGLVTCRAAEAPDACAGRHRRVCAARLAPPAHRGGSRRAARHLSNGKSRRFRDRHSARARSHPAVALLSLPNRARHRGHARCESRAHSLRAGVVTVVLPARLDPRCDVVGSRADGSIADEAVWRRETERLIQLPRAQDNLVQVLVRWLGAEQVLAAEVVDTTAFPTFDSVRDDMLLETRQFLGGLLGDREPFKDLLTSRAPKSAPPSRPSTACRQRHRRSNGDAPGEPALRHSDPSGHRLRLGQAECSVHRGLFVFRELLCGQVPSPPAGTNITPPAGIKTEREFAAYRAANSCKGCHSNFDPIGLSYRESRSLRPVHHRTRWRDGHLERHDHTR